MTITEAAQVAITTLAPNGAPPLSAGAHSPHSGKACFMEYASLLAGEPWSASPACTHPVIASMARAVNDSLSDSRRHEIAELIPSVIGTADRREDGQERLVLSVRLAAWCARQVLDLAQDRAVALAAIEAAEAWCDNPCEETAVHAAVHAAAYNAAYATAAAMDPATATAYAAAAAIYAVDAPVAANAAVYAASDAALPGLLRGLIAEHARLTADES
jgi:hypothetical protein